MTEPDHGTRQRGSGTTLIEILMAVVLMALPSPRSWPGWQRPRSPAGSITEQTDAHVVIVSAAESLRDDARNPFSCTVTGYNALLGVTLPAGWSAGNVQLVVATAQSGYWGDGAFRTATCSPATDLQRLTLKATSPDGRAVEQLTVFKRKP